MIKRYIREGKRPETLVDKFDIAFFLTQPGRRSSLIGIKLISLLN
jgi:hypothetical protein